MTSKDDCVRKYVEYKTTHGAIPKRKDFFKFKEKKTVEIIKK